MNNAPYSRKCLVWRINAYLTATYIYCYPYLYYVVHMGKHKKEQKILVDITVTLRGRDSESVLESKTVYKYVPADRFEERSEASIEGVCVQIDKVYIEGNMLRCSGFLDTLGEKGRFESVIRQLTENGWSAHAPKIKHVSAPQVRKGIRFLGPIIFVLLAIGVAAAALLPRGIPAGLCYLGRYDPLITALALTVACLGIKRTYKEDNSPYARISDGGKIAKAIRILGVLLVSMIIALSANFLLYPTYDGDLAALLMHAGDAVDTGEVVYYHPDHGNAPFGDDFGDMGFKEAYMLNSEQPFALIVARIDPRRIAETFTKYTEDAIFVRHGHTEYDIDTIGEMSIVFRYVDGADYNDRYFLSFFKKDVWIIMIDTSITRLEQYAREVAGII